MSSKSSLISSFEAPLAAILGGRSLDVVDVACDEENGAKRSGSRNSGSLWSSYLTETISTGFRPCSERMVHAQADAWLQWGTMSLFRVPGISFSVSQDIWPEVYSCRHNRIMEVDCLSILI